MPTIGSVLHSTISDLASGNAHVAGTGMPNTAGMTEAEKYDLYSKQAIENDTTGGDVQTDLENGEKVVMFIRKDTPLNANNDLGVYDDRAVVMWQDADGTKHVKEYEANVDPSGDYSYDEDAYGTDVNGDGNYNAGRLNDGTYGLNSLDAADGDLFRYQVRAPNNQEDSNGDGIFTDDDASAKQMDNGSFTIHAGHEDATGSAGCLSFRPGDMEDFEATLGDGSYTMVMVNENKL